MSNDIIDLYQPPFWLAFALALVVLVPLAAPRPRRVAQAAVNLGLLSWLLSWRALAALIVGLIGLWLALKLVPRKRSGPIVLIVGGAAVLGLFVLHKRPGLSSELHLARVNPLLLTVGFSYVALRLVELGRAVSEGRHPPPGLASVVNYLLPFHMLAAGPIQSYDEFVAQPAVPPPPGVADALAGAERIAFGLLKKYVLAQTLQRLFLTDFRTGGPYFLLEVQLHFLWLYLDFSAYSDIAVGVGRLIGVATPENFNKPYLARNLIDYWERWHISLSQFLRRNLFIPVQLALLRRTDGRRPLWCASVAFAVTFVLCGLWHDLGPGWLLWGAAQAGGLILTNLYRAALTARLGRLGMKAYLADRRVRVLATCLTYQFAAFSLVLVKRPLQELVT